MKRSGRELSSASVLPYSVQPYSVRAQAAAVGLAALTAALVTAAIDWDPPGGRKAGRVMVVKRHSEWSPTTKPVPYDVVVEPRLLARARATITRANLPLFAAVLRDVATARVGRDRRRDAGAAATCWQSRCPRTATAPRKLPRSNGSSCKAAAC